MKSRPADAEVKQEVTYPMEKTVQFMDQVLLTTVAPANTGQSARTQGTDSADFGSMVRQKQQQAKSQDSGNTQKSQQQNQTKKSDTKDVKDAKQPAQDKEPAAEQFVIAAALMYQVDFHIDDAQVVEAAPEEELLADGAFVPVLEIDITDQVQTAAEETAPEAEVVVQETVEEAPEQYEVVEHTVIERTDAPVEAVEEEEADDGFQAEVAGYEAPVFGPVEAAPVKVAAPTTEEPLDLQSDTGVEELANRIENLFYTEEGDSRVEFTLIPESLGKISVEITRSADGALHVQLSATTLRAAELLNRHSGGLEQAMAGSNRSNVQVEIKASEEAQRQFLNPNAEQQQEQQRRQQEQQRQRREDDEDRAPHEAVDFLQQLRLGLVDLGA